MHKPFFLLSDKADGPDPQGMDLKNSETGSISYQNNEH